MTVEVRRVDRADVPAVLDDVARLRITVFRRWPYLYEGSLEYERDYLKVYAENPRAVLIGAFVDGRMVGASTGTPMTDHAEEFARPLAILGWNIADVFYCAESVLMSEWHGQGIGHRFFDLREAAVREMDQTYSVFASVIRPDGHPSRPDTARDLAPFWEKRGYRRLDAPPATFRWRDVGEAEETTKPLALWGKRL